MLFFLFYSLHGDALQLVAASLLFERGWRFHKQVEELVLSSIDDVVAAVIVVVVSVGIVVVVVVPSARGQL